MYSYREKYLREKTLFLIKTDILNVLVYIHLVSISGKNRQLKLVSNGRLITFYVTSHHITWSHKR